MYYGIHTTYTTSSPPETGRGARAGVALLSLSSRATRALHTASALQVQALQRGTRDRTYATVRRTRYGHTRATRTARHRHGPHRHSKSMCLPCVVEHANGDALTHIWSYHNVNVTLLTACSHADTLINPRVRPIPGVQSSAPRGLT